jgi:ribosomal protein S7
MVQKKLKKAYNIYLKFFYNKSIKYKIYKDLGILRINKKQLKIDSLYKKFFILKFINILTKKGKKNIAENILYNYLLNFKLLLKKNKNIFIKNKINYNSYILIFSAVLKYIKIPFNVKNIRIGGRVYMVPFLVKIKQQQTVAIKYLLNNFILKNKLVFKDILNIFSLQSSLNKNITDYYKIAYDNRAFSHYRWF